MKVRLTTRLEWEVEDEIDAIVNTQPPRRKAFPHLSITSRRYRPLIVLAAILLLLAIAIAGARLVDQAESNIAQTEREIELAIEADGWQQEWSALKPNIQSIELHKDLAIVQMAVEDGGVSQGTAMAGGILYYRYSAEGWERVEVNETEPGPYLYQETDHLYLQYRQVDQSEVEALMPAIEAFNADLHRDFGLELPPAHEKVNIRVAIVAGRQQLASLDLVEYITWESNGIVVLSPHFSRVRTTRASADVMKDAIRANVARQIILLAVEKYQPQAVWRPLVDGLQLWAYSAHREFDSDLANLLRQQLASEVPLRLPVLSTLPLPLYNLDETQVTGWQQSVVVLKTVIDYMVATYGRHSLARLLDGMHHHDSWQSLIPAVFDVSIEEFESGWQAYLTAQYDLRP
jgi:hypothetical protein